MTVSRLARSRAQMWSDLLVALGGADSYKTMSEEEMLAAIRNTYGGSVSALTTSKSDLLASIVSAAGGSASDLTEDEEQMLAELLSALGGSGSALTSSPDALLAASVDAAGGDGPYVAKAISVDGVTELFIDSLACTDNGNFSMSGWFKMAEVPSDARNIFVSDPNNQYNNFAFIGQARGDDTTLGNLGAELWVGVDETKSAIEFDADCFSGGAWHHVLMSFEMNHPNGEKLYKVFVDDVDIADTNPSPDQGIAGIALINALQIYIFGDGSGGNGFVGDVADLWIAPGVSLFDGSTIPEATRRTFISADGKPVDPTGFPSAACLFSGDADSFGANQGTGGAASWTGGTPTNATTSPSD
jgi:hypothetical protein